MTGGKNDTKPILELDKHTAIICSPSTGIIILQSPSAGLGVTLLKLMKPFGAVSMMNASRNVHFWLLRRTDIQTIVTHMYTDWSPTMMRLGGRACLYPGKYGQDYFTDLVGHESSLYGAQLMCRDIARSTLLRASLIMVSTELPVFGTSKLDKDMPRVVT